MSLSRGGPPSLPASGYAISELPLQLPEASWLKALVEKSRPRKVTKASWLKSLRKPKLQGYYCQQAATAWREVLPVSSFQ